MKPLLRQDYGPRTDGRELTVSDLTSAPQRPYSLGGGFCAGRSERDVTSRTELRQPIMMPNAPPLLQPPEPQSAARH